jgi:hypothetical protein
LLVDKSEKGVKLLKVSSTIYNLGVFFLEGETALQQGRPLLMSGISKAFQPKVNMELTKP